MATIGGVAGEKSGTYLIPEGTVMSTGPEHKFVDPVLGDSSYTVENGEVVSIRCGEIEFKVGQLVNVEAPNLPRLNTTSDTKASGSIYGFNRPGEGEEDRIEVNVLIDAQKSGIPNVLNNTIIEAYPEDITPVEGS